MGKIKTYEQFNESFNTDRKYFRLNGHFIDDIDNEVTLIATNYDDLEEDGTGYDPDLYGFDENEIQLAIESGEVVDGSYIITSYTVI